MTPALPHAPSASARGDRLSREEVISLLNIPSHLAERSGDAVSLQVYYAKYKACLQAIHAMEDKIGKGEWIGKKWLQRDIIELFIGKSMWHEYLKTTFAMVADYPKMKSWLEGGEDCPSDLEVWGAVKTSYNFADLEKYLDEQRKKQGIKKKAGRKPGDQGGKKPGDQSGKKPGDQSGRKRKSKSSV